MARKIEIEIVGDSASFERALGRASKKSSTFGDALNKGALASTAALGLLAVGAKKTVDAASNLNEQMNKVGVVFGPASKGVIEFGKDAASSLGISNRAALEAAGVFGNMLVPMGFGRKAAADMSTQFVSLAADMASFNNADPSEVLEALRSGLAGESEPLRKFGVFLSDARLKAEAFKMGLYSGKGALDAHAKAAATSAVIMKDTADAQGDFARTSESAANAARIQAAKTEDLNATIGKGLLPVYESLQGILLQVTSLMSEHTTTVKVAAGILATLAVAVLAVKAAMVTWSAATTIATAAQWLLNAALTANPIGIVIAALAALTAGLIIAYQKSETFRAIVNGAFTAVKTAATAVIDFFKANWPIIAILITGPFAPLVAAAIGLFKIKDSLIAAFNSTKTWVSDHWPIIATIISGPFAPVVALATGAFGLRSALVGAFQDMISGVRSKIDALLDLIRDLPDRILRALGNVSGLLYNAGAAIIGGLISGLTSRLGEVTSLASSIAGKIASVKGPIEYDRKLLVPHGEAIIQGLQRGLEGSMGKLLGSVGGFAPSIQAAVVAPGAAAGQGAARTSVALPANGAGGMAGGSAQGPPTVIQLVLDRRVIAEVLRTDLIRTGKRNGGGVLGGLG